MFEIKEKSFYLNGEKFHIYSGSMHYFRIPHEYWEDRLLKLKAAGFNTVETYVAWNMHEPREGEFCFEGQSDVVRFIEHHFDHIPHYMEHYGQNYGLILYHTEIEGNYPDTAIYADGVHDIAYVYVNKKFVGKFNRAVPRLS